MLVTFATNKLEITICHSSLKETNCDFKIIWKRTRLPELPEALEQALSCSNVCAPAEEKPRERMGSVTGCKIRLRAQGKVRSVEAESEASVCWLRSTSPFP